MDITKAPIVELKDTLAIFNEVLANPEKYFIHQCEADIGSASVQNTPTDGSQMYNRISMSLVFLDRTKVPTVKTQDPPKVG